MNTQVRTLFEEALIKSLDVIRPLVSQYTEPYLIWTPTGHGWHGQDISQPDWALIALATEKAVEDINSDFIKLFRKAYPEYAGLVSFAGLGGMNITFSSNYLVRKAVGKLWERYGSLELSQGEIAAVSQEFADFIDLSTVKVQFKAVLANFHMDGRTIDLPRNMVIRRMSEKEVSEIYGGYTRQMGYMPSRGLMMDEYIIDGGFEATKLVGPLQPDDVQPPEYRSDLDRAILALRTFKEGMVGYDSVRLYTEKFCPVVLPTIGTMFSTPPGRYQIAEAEIEPLQQHAKQIFDISEPAMELACSRLADAETRLSPRDRLLDAVIGMEALLLAGLSKEDRRGELRFRFSLHYSTLFPDPDKRLEAFRIARSLYDLRSIIAHGDMPPEGECRVGSKKMSLDEAANKACEVLRKVIHFFLPREGKAPYKNGDYWQRKYLCLDEN